MRFRQWILSEGPKPEHCYARSWLEDPTLPSALPSVQLFTDPSSIDDRLTKITWPPTIFNVIPAEYPCEEKSIEFHHSDEERFLEHVEKLIDEVHLAALCCDSNGADVVYWRLAIHRTVMKLALLFDRSPQFLHRLDWLHQTICQAWDRVAIGHYIDLFQILYDEYPKIRSMWTEKEKSWSKNSLEGYVHQRLLAKPNDFTEEVIYSLPLSSFPSPMVCLLIPGLALPGHQHRVAFWQKNLSQISSVFLSSSIHLDHRHDPSEVQSAYDDILKKFREIRQSFPNHQILFVGWNVGCILALKAALRCPISSIVCLGLPWNALSEESKNDFTQINSSILFVTGTNERREIVEKYRQRLKGRNALIEIGFTDDQLRMSEHGKTQFRLTQAMLEKSLMDEMIDFLQILSPKTSRPSETNEEIDPELKRKRLEENSEEIFLFTGDVSSSLQAQTLSIAPEQDPHALLLQSSLPSSNNRKRKTTANVADPTVQKKARQSKAKVAAPKKKATKANSTPATPTTSILNTLLQLPSHQPKTRSIEENSTFVNKFLPTHSVRSEE